MDQSDRELVAQYFRDKRSNPGRIGCPERSVLEQIAAGKHPLVSPWYDHLAVCGECFRDTEDIRRNMAPARPHRQLWWIAGLAAGLLIGAVLLWNGPSSKDAMKAGGEPPRQEMPLRQRPAAPIATLDLSSFSIVRGDPSSRTPDAPAIRAISQTIHVILPPASEPGVYHAKLLDRELKPVRESTGSAAIKDGRTVLRIALDASVPPSPYQLALQHEGDEWRLYPLEVTDH